MTVGFVGVKAAYYINYILISDLDIAGTFFCKRWKIVWHLNIIIFW